MAEQTGQHGYLFRFDKVNATALHMLLQLHLGMKSIRLTSLLMACSGVISGFFFPKGGETFRLTREMLLCFSASFVLNTAFVVWTRLLQIEEHMKIVNLMNFMGQLFIAGMAIAGIQLFGATGVWLAQPLADILSLLSVLVWIMAGLRRLPRCAEEWMKLPEGFGAKAEDVLEATVNSMEEVA